MTFAMLHNEGNGAINANQENGSIDRWDSADADNKDDFEGFGGFTATATGTGGYKWVDVVPGWHNHSQLEAVQEGGGQIGPFNFEFRNIDNANDTVPTEQPLAAPDAGSSIAGEPRYRQSANARRMEKRWLSRERKVEGGGEDKKTEGGLVWEVAVERRGNDHGCAKGGGWSSSQHRDSW